MLPDPNPTPDEMPSLAPRTRAPSMPAALLSMALALAAGAGCGAEGPAAPSSETPAGRRLHSLLAVGDTGHYAGWFRHFKGQMAVARDLAREDERSRVDGLLLLGDNFYPHGLPKDRVIEYVDERLVLPFCRFVELGSAAPERLRRSCQAPGAAGRPLFAVLGNHDYTLEESPRLQREVVPTLIANWRMPGEAAAWVRLADGLSLILLDNEAFRHHGADPDLLIRVLQEAPGPFRIVAMHRPLSLSQPEWKLARRIERSGVPVQLALSGHLHSLRVAVRPDQPPALRVVAGSGSSARPLDEHLEQERLAHRALGFARIDFVEEEGGRRLVVSLFESAPMLLLRRGDAALVARWSVDAEGRVREDVAGPAD